MTGMRKLLILILLGICASGCRVYDIEEVLLQREDISLTVRGAEMLVYKPETFQIGYNDLKNEYRVFDDAMGNWFVLRCQERPAAEGQEVKASLSWTTSDNTRTKSGLTFRVEKTDQEGLIWLWCATEAIGVVVKEL